MRIARWLLVALLVGCGSTTSKAPVETVALTTADTTTTTTTTAAATTTSTTPSAMATWVAQNLAAGRPSALVLPGFGTDARMLTAFDPNARTTNADSRVLLADGALLELPSPLRSGDGATLAGVGDHVILVAAVDGHLTWWSVDAAHTGWTRGPDTGAVAGPPEIPIPRRLGEMLLVTERAGGLLFSPDLIVQPMETPPAAGLLQFTTTIGSQAYTLGKDYLPFVDPGDTPLTQPWEYHAVANAWVKVPIPAWIGCAHRCNWSAVHEAGDLYLEVPVGNQIVKLLPDQSVGAYDVDTRQWRHLDTPPFVLSTPSTALLGDHLLVVAPASPNGDPQPIGTVGLLDVTTGHWTTTALPIAATTANWLTEMRTAGDTAFLRYNVIDTGSGAVQPPVFAYDLATGAWRTATAAETAAWPPPEAFPDPVGVRSLLG